MPKIEKDLLKVKGSDGQWHYIPAVGGSSTPTWTTVQNKPFESLGDGLSVDENGVLFAQGGGGSANAVQYVAQELTDEQKAQARENIGAGTSSFSGSYNDLTSKPTIPTQVTIDSTLKQSGQAADAKAVGDALQHFTPTEALNSDFRVIELTFATKLDKNQGVGNAGKILGIGEDGNVVPQNKPTYTLTDADKTAVAEEVVADGIAATLTDMPSGGAGAWEELIDTTIEAGEGITAISLNLPKSDIAKGYACQLEFTKSTGDAWAGNANMTPRINGALMGYFLFNDDLSKNSINYFAIGNFESLGNGYIDFARHVYSLDNNPSNVIRQLGANKFTANVTGKFEMGFAGKTYIGTAKIKVWGRYK